MLSLITGIIGASVAVGEDAGERAEITRANWGAETGFPPALDFPGYSAGMVIDETNADRFAPLLPEPVRMLVKKYKMRIATRDYTPYAPSDGYIAATNRNRGKAQLVDIGVKTDAAGLAGYESGMPFPKPQNGAELAWNFFHNYHGDDGRHEFGVYWISASRGVEKHEVWRWTLISNVMHRTDIDPRPRLEELAKENVEGVSLTEILQPLDRKGQLALYKVYDHPTDREGWVYIPSQKRTMRFQSDSHGESWNNTDLFYEDIRGYSGRPEWMTWRILEKTTMLAPMDAGVEYGRDAAAKTYDFENWPHWNPRLAWQLRPVYAVELTPKLARYPYGRQVLYLDAEAGFAFAKAAYDRKGQLWKVQINAANASGNPSSKPLTIATSLVVDVQQEHATAFPWHSYEVNVGVDPHLFSLTTLRKMAR